MRQKSFFWHLFPYFLVVTILSSTIIVLYSIHEFKNSTIELTKTHLEKEIRLFSGMIESVDYRLEPFDDKRLQDLGEKTKTRYTIIRPDGYVIADSHEDHLKMKNHRDRPEFSEAIKTGYGTNRRYSETYRRDLVYVAIPLRHNDTLKAVLRAAVPIVNINEWLRKTSAQVILISIGAFLAALILSVLLSQMLSRPLRRLGRLAETFSPEEREYYPEIYSSIKEISQLSGAVRSMALQLSDRIQTMEKNRNEQDAILSSMIEGVVALDADEHIVMVNDAAGRIFGFEYLKVHGKLVQEVIRNRSFIEFMQKILVSGVPQKEEIKINAERETVVELQGTIINPGENIAERGTVCVIHDITHLKRLETMRKDFVANVSHELRTPLTSIKGFVETLLDGARHDPLESERFLSIINAQVDRLNALIGDLLTLSKLEKDSNGGGVEEMAGVVIEEVLTEAISMLQHKAGAKGIVIKKMGTLDLVVWMNPSLFQQALVNLLDNAINYSPEKTTVTVIVKDTGANHEVKVSDQGVGMAREHLSRIFERFYRIDKARSRKVGGTGLGLSIVKHIVNLHHGSIMVESEIGKGSTFTITLPYKK